MPALQVRDFPDDLYEQLKVCAAREHRSIAQQTVAFVEQGVRQYGGDYYWDGQTLHRPPQLFTFDTEKDRQVRIERRRALFEELDKLPSIEASGDFPDPAQLVRECRREQDRRTSDLLGLPYDGSLDAQEA